MSMRSNLRIRKRLKSFLCSSNLFHRNCETASALPSALLALRPTPLIDAGCIGSLSQPRAIGIMTCGMSDDQEKIVCPDSLPFLSLLLLLFLLLFLPLVFQPPIPPTLFPPLPSPPLPIPLCCYRKADPEDTRDVSLVRDGAW